MNWLNYFKENRANRHSIPWEQDIHVEPHQRLPLICSLQSFQIGEQGDGHQLQALADQHGDPDYAQAIRLFIGEEQEHARLLAQVLGKMKAKLLSFHWVDGVFKSLCGLMGLHSKLAILLTAEMIAKHYYSALYQGIDNAVLKAVFGQICHDEEGHIGFHIDFLQRRAMTQSTPLRYLLRSGWFLFFNISCLVVIWDHRAILSAVKVSKIDFLRQCNATFRAVTAPIFTEAEHTFSVKWGAS